MALPPLPKYPSYQLGKKPTWNYGVKRPNMVAARSVSPYPGPSPENDYGQNALYPGGYQGKPNPVDMGTFFTSGPGYATSKGTFDQGASVEQTTPLTDYGALINGDWEVQDAEAAMGAQMARARGDFQSSLRQQLIDLGISDTSKIGNLSKYIDADTIKAAVANKYSSTAQNAQTAERTTAQNNAALAARGILSSGQTTKSAEDVLAGQESANYSGLRSFLEGGAQGLSGLSDLEYNLARGVAQARGAAAARAAAYGPGGEGTGVDQYGLSTTNYDTYDPKAAAAARSSTASMVNNMLTQQLAAQRRAAAARARSRSRYQAMGPYGPYGPAKYTAANRPYYGR